LVIVFGLSWLLLSIAVLAFYGVIPGANLPMEVFALAATLLILLQRLCGSLDHRRTGWCARAVCTPPS
jgi:hypothetical protein